MPTDTPPERLPNHARKFALRGVAWSLGLFGLLRLSWIEAHAVLPLTRVQARVAGLLRRAGAARSTSRSRAAAPTRWRCASGRSSRIPSRGGRAWPARPAASR